ncbi:twin-arginine translocase subunit TatB [Stenotrophomonas panacihumi]|nr:twin-arginine translocase subunit TatB [Stenotrophomonas panacihumi]
MFDIGFSELLLIAIVALVVLGPERLPKAARFAGLWVRRARNQWDSVKQELERELEAEELKRNLQSVQSSLREAESQMRQGHEQVREHGQALHDEVARDVDIRTGSDAAPAPVAETPATPPPAEPAPPEKQP